ncbi:MAG TPA: AmmeMemoRadiSam system protein A, partial [Azonexus sp.]|nr:AmmeMemoRadiSam system protein A [Azonexus sp.]
MDELGNALLRHARAAIAEALGEPAPAAPDLAALHEPGATFVTLTQGGELRGCIGSLEAHRPLLDDVCANARAAALRDPRFPPLVASELARTRVEVSLLTPAEPLPVASEADACR